MSVEWGREQERLTAVFFPWDKFTTTTLPGSAGTGSLSSGQLSDQQSSP